MTIIAKSLAMRIPFLFLFFFVAIGPSINAQIRGKVVDATDQSPLPGAHVFLDGTQQGTVTDDTGRFTLPLSGFNSGSLVVSFVGYKSRVINLNGAEAGPLTVELQPDAQNLATAEVRAGASKKRKRWLRQFRKDFLGSSNYAAGCKILNPQVLRFEEKDGYLFAAANQLIQIENDATGYRVHFLLEHFQSNGTTVSYAGKALFSPMHSDDKKTLKKWEANRAKIWKASKRRFLLALVHDRLAAEGYSVAAGRINPENEFEAAQRIVGTADIVKPQPGGYYKVRLPAVLRVIHGFERPEKEAPLASISLGKDHETSRLTHNDGREEEQYSFLVATKPVVVISAYGTFTEPEQVYEFGHFASQRVAEMLPLEYGQAGAPQEAQVPVKNGFQLSGLRIPLEQIRSGGPPRDGIPALDRPHFTNAGDAAFLSEDDWVLGVEYNFTAKAYPINILNWHEIVNDRFAGEPVVLTWCPLCGSGMAFRGRDSKGLVRQFGVSGLLYNSDVLMYDRQSESLWSQVMGEAVAGPASGNKLEMLPTELCTWGSWKARHPGTSVLTPDTGFDRDYNQDPYAAYQRSGNLMFPVSAQSDALPPKSRVLGLEINGQFKAYPLQWLKKKKKVVETFAGKQVQIEWDAKAKAPQLTVDGAPWPAVNLFWFAWYAFHPDTQLMKP